MKSQKLFLQSKWKGNSQFFCYNRAIIVKGRGKIVQYFLYLLYIQNFIIFQLLTGQFYYQNHDNISAVVITVIFFAISLYHLTKTCYTDPGAIIPSDQDHNQEDIQNEINIKNSKFYASITQNYKYDDLELIQNLQSNDLIQQTQKKPDIYTEIDARIYQYRYCNTCKIIRPPLASHCSTCNICVKGFDHHCGVVNNCIGIRNWKNFVLFIFFTTCLLLTMTIYGIFQLENIETKYHFIEKTAQQNHQILWIMLVLLLILALPFKNVIKMLVLLTQAMLALTFLIHLNQNINQTIQYYENPVYLLVFIIEYKIILLFAFGNSVGQCYHATLFKTAKEISSINELYYQKLHLNLQIQKESTPNCRQRLINIFKFLTYEVPKSDILLD